MKNSIKQFGLWSWGHVIYDYRGYLDNMKKLGMNSVIIWNDIVPLNAVDVLDYAHSLGIKVIWGFAWGWVDNCGKNITSIDSETVQKISDEVLEVFEKEYKDISPDGIYFQSFTELGSDYIGGLCLAEVVTEFVNSTAARIYEIAPSCEILFGLHATAVKNHLDKIGKTDPRIRIVWEDCGAFPYAYDPLESDKYDETSDFVEKLLHLRGENEKCGFIIKGMTTLDWTKFEYHTEPYSIGGADREFIEQRLVEKQPKWDTVTEGWRKNHLFCVEAVKQIAFSDSDAYVYGLVEDGMFEAKIQEPVELLADLIKNPNLSENDIKANLK